MKAIQIMMDERLLARLDKDPAVRRLGRSAVFRVALEAFLRHRRKRELSDAYRRAYAPRRMGRAELTGWADEGVWPEA